MYNTTKKFINLLDVRGREIGENDYVLFSESGSIYNTFVGHVKSVGLNYKEICYLGDYTENISNFLILDNYKSRVNLLTQSRVLHTFMEIGYILDTNIYPNMLVYLRDLINISGYNSDNKISELLGYELKPFDLVMFRNLNTNKWDYGLMISNGHIFCFQSRKYSPYLVLKLNTLTEQEKKIRSQLYRNYYSTIGVSENRDDNTGCVYHTNESYFLNLGKRIIKSKYEYGYNIDISKPIWVKIDKDSYAKMCCKNDIEFLNDLKDYMKKFIYLKTNNVIKLYNILQVFRSKADIVVKYNLPKEIDLEYLILEEVQ